MEDEKIWRQAHIRMTQEQWQAIKEAADYVGVPVSAYMRIKSLEAARAET
jgi:hypothetical protein